MAIKAHYILITPNRRYYSCGRPISELDDILRGQKILTASFAFRRKKMHLELFVNVEFTFLRYAVKS